MCEKGRCEQLYDSQTSVSVNFQDRYLVVTWVFLHISWGWKQSPGILQQDRAEIRNPTSPSQPQPLPLSSAHTAKHLGKAAYLATSSNKTRRWCEMKCCCWSICGVLERVGLGGLKGRIIKLFEDLYRKLKKIHQWDLILALLLHIWADIMILNTQPYVEIWT